MRQVLSTEVQRGKQGASLDCGNPVICPGSRRQKCLAPRMSVSELKGALKWG